MNFFIIIIDETRSYATCDLSPVCTDVRLQVLTQKQIGCCFSIYKVFFIKLYVEVRSYCFSEFPGVKCPKVKLDITGEVDRYEI